MVDDWTLMNHLWAFARMFVMEVHVMLDAWAAYAFFVKVVRLYFF